MVDRDTFLALLLRHEVEIKAFVASLVRDPHTRDDVFQEVALTLWQQPDRYDPTRPFGAWARGIAARKVLQRRDRDRRFPLAFPPETIEAMASAFERTEGAEASWLAALRECLKKLPQKAQRLLKLRYEEGLHGNEIGRQTHQTRGAVYQAMWRARAALEQCIRRRLSDHGEDA
ncbi:MAG: sigma-70 family RNA polymerase sigma factor [Candidatus Brocadiae bacterium]|nr:sigma-70 family RNA polymerase sigma factor [Candidatus Brocadiia bacterium]